METTRRLPERAGVVVVGGGILGVCVAYWLSALYDTRILVLDASPGPAQHETYRNTGVIHRPFYLHPERKRVFARSSLLSYPLWATLARECSLPWKEVGTLNVALTQGDTRAVEDYLRWGLRNGLTEDELRLADGREVSGVEPEVKCLSALISKKDVSVDFRAFALQLLFRAKKRGAEFFGGCQVRGIKEAGGRALVALETTGGTSTTECELVVNAAGGGALALAHSCGLGEGLAQLNFRGEYWRVDEPFASRVRSNVYRPPRYPAFPFLDPHFVVRSDGTRQIGPNAVLVAGPYVYRGAGILNSRELLSPPLRPKLALLGERTFLRLVSGEWRTSLSKTAMCARVQKFVPNLTAGMLHGRAVFGVRGSVIGSEGFVPEAVVLHGSSSLHILNYNSPGATGAPSFSAMVVAKIAALGLADRLPRRRSPEEDFGWKYEKALGESRGLF